MSDKAEAAQKWAEAKVALDAADAALGAARETQAKAQDAEFHAWQALETLSGRVSATPIEIAPDVIEVEPRDVVSAAGYSFRHSLPSRPIG